MTSSIDPMEPNLERKIPARKRGFWRGFGAGYAAKWLVLLVLFCVVYVVRPFIWPIIYGVPYVAQKGPMVIGSNEWYFFLFIALISSLICGYVAAHWSKENSWSALVALALLAVVFSAFQVPETSSLLILGIWFFGMPIGVLLGGFFYISSEKKA